MTKRRDDPMDALFELSDQLFGPVEELDREDVARLLAEAGLDSDAVKRRLYERASELRGGFWSRNVDVPQYLVDFLAQLRPPDLPTSDPTVAAASARKWVSQLLMPRRLPREVEVAFAFRDKAESMDDADAVLLEELAERLRKKAGEEKR